MCTIIKVKRKITDDPVDCLIFECKRKKTETSPATNVAPSFKELLKYAGSTQHENEIGNKIKEVSSKMRHKSTRKELEEEFKSYRRASHTNTKTTPLKNTQIESKSHRYILLDKKRSILSNESKSTTNITTSKEGDDVNIIDVISFDYLDDSHLNTKQNVQGQEKPTNDTITCNGVPLIREKKVNASPNNKKTVTQAASASDYIYDIYYMKNAEINLELLDPNNFELKSCNYDDALLLLNDNDKDNDSEDIYDDDEDSNDEQNYRNDYPDDEDDYGEDNYGEDADEYDEYEFRSAKDDNNLSSFMKKSCTIDRSFYEDEAENEDDDYDEYDGDEALSKNYSAYKKKLIRDLENEEKLIRDLQSKI